MYCRFENGVHPREPLGDLLLATTDHTSSLQDHITFLTKVKQIQFAIQNKYVYLTNIVLSENLISKIDDSQQKL